jgi:hypothetical protein
MNNNYKREIQRAWNIFQPKYWVYNFLGECCWGFELLLLVCFSMFWVFVTFTVVTLMGEKNYLEMVSSVCSWFFLVYGPATCGTGHQQAISCRLSSFLLFSCVFRCFQIRTFHFQASSSGYLIFPIYHLYFWRL